MIRCVGAALRGDGNPPEVPVIRTVLRAYNGVWGVPIKKDGLRPSISAPFLRQRIYTLIRRKV